jgi:hypothetical protein
MEAYPMDVRPLLRPSLASAAAALLLAACSGGGAQFSPPAAQGPAAQSRAISAVTLPHPLSFAYAASLYLPGGQTHGDSSGLYFVDPVTVKAQMYVSQFGSTASLPGEVNDYNGNNKKNGKPICTDPNLTGVNGIEVDSTNELWIPNETVSGTNEIISQAPHCGKAGVVLADPNGQPADIAFAASGIRYVSDIVSNGSAAGDISVYPKGAMSPNSKLTNKNVFLSIGVAVDSKGNVYQSYLKTSEASGGVLEFVKGKMPGKPLKGVTITVPGTLIIDKNDNLILSDQSANTLNTYAPPYTKPATSFPLKGQSVQCSLNETETNVACANVGLNEVDVYAYPAGAYMYTFTKGLNPSTSTIGVAQDPAEN